MRVDVIIERTLSLATSIVKRQRQRWVWQSRDEFGVSCCMHLTSERCAYSHGLKLGFVGTLPADDGSMKKLLAMFDAVKRLTEVRVESSDGVSCVHRSYGSVFALDAFEFQPRDVRQGRTSLRVPLRQ